MAAWVAEHRPEVTWHCPQLPASPREAVAQQLAHVQDWPVATSAVIGSSLGGFYATALAERLGIPPSRMVALVDGLEEMGLLERRPDPDDRRVRGLFLTRKGRTVLEKAGKIAIDYETQLCAGINREERDQLIDLLQRLQVTQTDLGGVHPGMSE